MHSGNVFLLYLIVFLQIVLSFPTIFMSHKTEDILLKMEALPFLQPLQLIQF